MGRVARGRTGQGGYTLIELIIAVALGALLMTALTSVILTTVQAVTTASSRVEASAQLRNFQYLAYDDFAASAVPSPSGCGTPSLPCTTQPLVLNGLRASNQSPPIISSFQVSYAWVSSKFVDRQSGSLTTHAATNVTAFSWYVDGNSTVVVSLTIKVQAYSESQTLRFYPRMNP
jgi:prepilin-type N-terminal cleavage/methylation domain-containing protein